MSSTLCLSLPDFGQMLQNPRWLGIYIFVLLGGALLGGLVLGTAGKYGALLFWKELSSGAVLRLRLLGGLGGAVTALALIGDGSGLGFGPGAGGFPGKGPGVSSGKTAPDSLTDKLPPPAPEKPSPRPIRIVLLGPDTQPPMQEPGGYFAFEDEPRPRALNVEGVMDRLRQLRDDGRAESVDLIGSPGSSSASRTMIHTLRARVLEELRLPFSQPDFNANPLKDRVHYKPASES